MQCTVRWLELDHQTHTSAGPGSLGHRLELASPRSLIGPQPEYWPVIGHKRAQAAVTGTPPGSAPPVAAAQIYGSLQVAVLRQ